MFMTEWTIGTGAGFAPVRALREMVRVQEQGVLSEAEFDALDAVAAHLFVRTDAGAPIAVGRMYPCPECDAVRMDRLVVAPKFRGRLYDDLLLRVMLYKAQQMPFATIEAAMQPEAKQLLARFGFQSAAGQACGGTLMAVPRGGVIWDSACKHEGHGNPERE